MLWFLKTSQRSNVSPNTFGSKRLRSIFHLTTLGKNGVHGANSFRYFFLSADERKKGKASFPNALKVLKEWSSYMYSREGEHTAASLCDMFSRTYENPFLKRMIYSLFRVNVMHRLWLNAINRKVMWGQIQFCLSCACTLTHKPRIQVNVKSSDLEKSPILMKLQFGPGCGHMHT